MMTFHERSDQLALLQQMQTEAETSGRMVVVTGRRRSGRTTLVLEATKARPTLYLYAARKAEALLCYELAAQAEEKLGLTGFEEVAEFRTLFKHLMAATKERAFNIIIDEFQEFQTINPNLLIDLQNIWDRNQERARLCLLLIGTNTGQTAKLFEGDKAPLRGRVHAHIELPPLSIASMQQLLKDANPKCSVQDFLTFYAFTGGVPLYVKRIFDAQATTSDRMLALLLKEEHTLLYEGKNVLVEDFGKEYTIYFSVLSCLTRGCRSRAFIEDYLQKEIGGYLTRMETDFHIIKKASPLFSRSGNKNVRYEICDNFLLFWFHFIFPNLDFVETHQMEKLHQRVKEAMPAFHRAMLLPFYKQKLRETRRFTHFGAWWDMNAEEEIPLIAYNEHTKEVLLAAVAESEENLTIETLQTRTEVLSENFKNFKPSYKLIDWGDIF